MGNIFLLIGLWGVALLSSGFTITIAYRTLYYITGKKDWAMTLGPQIAFTGLILSCLLIPGAQLLNFRFVRLVMIIFIVVLFSFFGSF